VVREGTVENSGATASSGNDKKEPFVPLVGVPLLIDGYMTTAILDTGANATIVEQRIWNEATGGAPLDPYNQKTITATGEDFPMKGQGEVSIRLGPHTLEAKRVIVSDRSPNDCVMGLDTILALDPDAYLRIGKMKVPLSSKSGQQQSAICKVIADGHETSALVDSGCAASPISLELAQQLAVRTPERNHIRPAPLRRVTDATGKPIAILGSIQLPIRIKGSDRPIEHDFLISEGVAPLTLGLDILLKMDPDTAIVIAGTKYRLQANKSNDPAIQLRAVNALSQQAKSPPSDDEDEEETPLDHSALDRPWTEKIDWVLDKCTLVGGQRDRLLHLLAEKRGAFSAHPLELSYTTKVVHRLDTGDATPVAGHSIRCPTELMPYMREMVEELLRIGIITHSNSPWRSPLFPVWKKRLSFTGNETPEQKHKVIRDALRWVCDFRGLNKVLVMNEGTELPHIESILDLLVNAQYISKIDMTSGYWQLSLDPETRDRSAFCCFMGTFVWKTTAMGIRTAAAAFQRLAQECLQPYLNIFATCYQDDVIIYSKTADEHLEHLRLVLDRLIEYNLKLKPSKCEFAVRTCKILGFIVSGDGIQVDPDKIAAVQRYKEPKNVKEVQQFLGLTGFNRRIIPGYCQIAAPLFNLLKAGTRFEFGEREQLAFNQLKAEIISDRVVVHARPGVPYIIYGDASYDGYGAILCQIVDGVERVIAYISRTLKPAELNYPVPHIEAGVIVWAVQKWHHYVCLAKITVKTDHKSLQWLLSAAHQNPRLTRWQVLLMSYDITIEYIPGDKQVADGLSRQGSAGKPEQGTKINTVIIKADSDEASTECLIEETVACGRGTLRRNIRGWQLFADLLEGMGTELQRHMGDHETRLECNAGTWEERTPRMTDTALMSLYDFERLTRHHEIVMDTERDGLDRLRDFIESMKEMRAFALDMMSAHEHLRTELHLIETEMVAKGLWRNDINDHDDWAHQSE
jgi:hypothetical protein